MTERLSNSKLGALLDLSHASVSRIRSGNRLPSLKVMAVIAGLTGWSLDDQVAARESGTYASCFEETFEGYTPNPLVPEQRRG
jgi:hypothetical protein